MVCFFPLPQCWFLCIQRYVAQLASTSSHHRIRCRRIRETYSARWWEVGRNYAWPVLHFSKKTRGCRLSEKHFRFTKSEGIYITYIYICIFIYVYVYKHVFIHLWYWEFRDKKRNIEDFPTLFWSCKHEVPDACRSWIQERQVKARILGCFTELLAVWCYGFMGVFVLVWPLLLHIKHI